MPSHSTDLQYLRQTIALAELSPPKPSNFRVGCIIVSETGTVLSTGYTLELEGNTHAEQCALTKAGQIFGQELSSTLKGSTLYTSLEPCSLRLSGNLPCVQRIIGTVECQEGIRRVVFGAKEPETFVKHSKSCQLLSEAGIDWSYLPEFEDEILAVAMAGHDTRHELPKEEAVDEQVILREVKRESVEAADQLEEQKERERAEQEREQAPRNRYKRMMEVEPGSEESWR